jgi:hypothetical protein
MTFTATATDADLPTNVLTFSLDPGAPVGSVINGSTGIFSWTPLTTGTVSVTVRVTDNGSPPLSDLETLTISVGPDETVPVVQNPGNMTVQAGSTLDRTVTGFDAHGLPLTFFKSPGSPAFMTVTTTGPTTGNIHLAPASTDVGDYFATVNATDGSRTGSTSFSIRVTAVQVNPPTLDPIGNKTVNEGECIAFTVTATTVSGTPAVFSVTPSTPGPSMTPDGHFNWCTTEANGLGAYPMTVCATDTALGSFACETFYITVLEINQPPVLNPIGDKTASLGVPLTFTATATDPDLPQFPLRFTLDPGAPAGATINIDTGSFSWTPTAMGTFFVTIRVTDSMTPVMSDAETIAIVVGSPPPTLQPIANMTLNEGEIATQTIAGSDPDNVPLTFTKVSGPLFMTVTTTSPTSGQIRLEPGFADASLYGALVRASNGTLFDQESFTILVQNVCRTPIANAGGPYAGLVGTPEGFNGAGSSDPDGGVLTYAWDFGDGSTGTGPTPSHTYTVPATYLVTLRVTNPCGLFDDDVVVATMTNRCSDALAFTQGGNDKISLGSGKPQACIQIQPVDNSFSVLDVDLASLVMIYQGARIAAVANKTAVGSDRNGDGIDEISACFTKADLQVLFADLQGTQIVNVGIEGRLFAGGAICTTNLDLTIKAGSGGNHATIRPNPLNPSAVLSFSTSKVGAAKVQLFDTQGRLIKTLLDQPSAAAGYHDVSIDGRDAAGNRLASGVYYVKIQSVEGTQAMAVTIIK